MQAINIRAIAYVMACVAACYGFSASAATVVPYAGDVFVSQGLGFQKINGATPVKVGDAVMVSPDGLAQVHLDDGNVITVSPGKVLNVPAKARTKDAALPNGAQETADFPTKAAPAGVPATMAPADAGWGFIPAFLLGAAGMGGAIALANERSTTGAQIALPSASSSPLAAEAGRSSTTGAQIALPSASSSPPTTGAQITSPSASSSPPTTGAQITSPSASSSPLPASP
jgi:hypothetical protein